MPQDSFKCKTMQTILEDLENFTLNTYVSRAHNYNLILNAIEKDKDVNEEVVKRLLAVCAHDLRILKYTGLALSIISAISTKAKQGKYEPEPDLLPSASAVMTMIKTIATVEPLEKVETLMTGGFDTVLAYPDKILEAVAEDYEGVFEVVLLYCNLRKPANVMQQVFSFLHRLLTILPQEKKTAFVESGISVWLSKIFPTAMAQIIATETVDDLTMEVLEKLTDEMVNMEYATTPHWQNILECICNSKQYPAIMKTLLHSGNDKWHRLWIVFIRLLKSRITIPLGGVGSPINSMLPVVESAFKVDAINRCRSFDCWKVLIDCFSHETVESNINKRLKLLIIPLKANNAKTEETALAKFGCWWHLLTKFHSKMDSFIDALLIIFLHFCFGKFNAADKTLVAPGMISSKLKRLCSQAMVDMVGHVNCNGCTDLPKLKSKLITTTHLVDHWNHWIFSVSTILMKTTNREYGLTKQQMTCLWKSYLRTIGELPENNIRKDLFAEILSIVDHYVKECKSDNIYLDIGFNILIMGLFEDDTKAKHLFKSGESDKDPVIRIVKTILTPCLYDYYLSLPPGQLASKLKCVAKVIVDPAVCSSKHFVGCLLVAIPANDFGLTFWNSLAEAACEVDYKCPNVIHDLLLWPVTSIEAFIDVKNAAMTWYKTYNLMCPKLKTGIDKEITAVLMSKLEEVAPTVYFKLCVILGVLKHSMTETSCAGGQELNLLLNLTKRIDNYESFEAIFPIMVEGIVAMMSVVTTSVNEAIAALILVSVKNVLHVLSRACKQRSNIEQLLILIGSLLKPLETLFAVDSYSKLIPAMTYHLLKYFPLLSNHSSTRNIYLSVMKTILAKSKESDTNFNKIKSVVQEMEKCNLKIAPPQSTHDNVDNPQFTTPPTNEVPKRVKRKEPSIVNTIVENGEEYVVVKSNWKFNPRKLTENQKEKLQRKREDIPALYQDLSQSQDEYKLASWKTDSQDTMSSSRSESVSSKPGQTIQTDTELLKNLSSTNVVPTILENFFSEKEKNSVTEEQPTSKVFTTSKVDVSTPSPKNTKSPRMALKDRVFRNVRNLMESSGLQKENKNSPDDQNDSDNNTKTPTHLKNNITTHIVSSAPPLLSADRPSRVKRKPKKFEDLELLTSKKSRYSLHDLHSDKTEQHSDDKNISKNVTNKDNEETTATSTDNAKDNYENKQLFEDVAMDITIEDSNNVKSEDNANNSTTINATSSEPDVIMIDDDNIEEKSNEDDVIWTDNQVIIIAYCTTPAKKSISTPDSSKHLNKISQPELGAELSVSSESQNVSTSKLVEVPTHDVPTNLNEVLIPKPTKLMEESLTLGSNVKEITSVKATKNNKDVSTPTASSTVESSNTKQCKGISTASKIALEVSIPSFAKDNNEVSTSESTKSCQELSTTTVSKDSKEAATAKPSSVSVESSTPKISKDIVSTAKMLRSTRICKEASTPKPSSDSVEVSTPKISKDIASITKSSKDFKESKEVSTPRSTRLCKEVSTPSGSKDCKEASTPKPASESVEVSAPKISKENLSITKISIDLKEPKDVSTPRSTRICKEISHPTGTKDCKEVSTPKPSSGTVEVSTPKTSKLSITKTSIDLKEPKELSTPRSTRICKEASTPKPASESVEVSAPKTSKDIVSVTKPSKDLKESKEVSTPRSTRTCKEVSTPTGTKYCKETSTPKPSSESVEVSTPKTSKEKLSITKTLIDLKEPKEVSNPRSTRTCKEVSTPTGTKDCKEASTPKLSSESVEVPTPKTSKDKLSITKTSNDLKETKEASTPRSTRICKEVSTPTGAKDRTVASTPKTAAESVEVSTSKISKDIVSITKTSKDLKDTKEMSTPRSTRICKEGSTPTESKDSKDETIVKSTDGVELCTSGINTDTESTTKTSRDHNKIKEVSTLRSIKICKEPLAAMGSIDSKEPSIIKPSRNSVELSPPIISKDINCASNLKTSKKSNDLVNKKMSDIEEILPSSRVSSPITTKDASTPKTTKENKDLVTPKVSPKGDDQKSTAKKSTLKKSRIEKELAIDMVQGHPYLKQTQKRLTRKALESANTGRRKSLAERLNKAKADGTKGRTKNKGSENVSSSSIVVDESQEKDSEPNEHTTFSDDLPYSDDVIESSQDSTATTISVKSTRKTPKKVPVVCVEKMISPVSNSDVNNSQSILDCVIRVSKLPFDNNDNKDDSILPVNKTILEEKSQDDLTENMDTEPLDDKDISEDVITISDNVPVLTIATEDSVVGPETQEIAEADTQPTDPTEFMDIDELQDNQAQSEKSTVKVLSTCVPESCSISNDVKKVAVNQAVAPKSLGVNNMVNIIAVTLSEATCADTEHTGGASSPFKDEAQRQQDFLNNTFEISPIKTMSPDRDKKSPSPETSSDYVVITLSSPVNSNGEPFEKCGSPEVFTEEKVSPDKRDQSPPRVEISVTNTSPSTSLSLKKNKPQVRSGGRAAQMLGLCVPDKVQVIINPERNEPGDAKKGSCTNSAARRNLRILYNSVSDNTESSNNPDDNEDSEHFLKFRRSLPAVNSSPAGPILKRKLAEIADDAMISPASKRKRVSFHDPPVSTTISVQKYIEPIGLRSPQNSAHKRLERQLRQNIPLRSPKRLDNVFKLDTVLTKTVESFTENDVIPITDDTQPFSMDETPEVEIVRVGDLNDSDPICPDLLDCKDPIENIAGELSSSAMRSLFIKEMEGKIETIGDLAKMTELEVNRLCIKAPKVKVAKKVLTDYAAKKAENVPSEITLTIDAGEFDEPMWDPEVKGTDTEVQPDKNHSMEIEVQTMDIPTTVTSVQTEIVPMAHIAIQTNESGSKSTEDIIKSCLSEKPDFVEQLGKHLEGTSIERLSEKLPFSSLTDLLMTKLTPSNTKVVLNRILEQECSSSNDRSKEMAFLREYLCGRFDANHLILLCSQILKNVYDKPI